MSSREYEAAQRQRCSTGYQQGRADMLAEVKEMVKREQRRTEKAGYSACDFYPRKACLRLLLARLGKMGRTP